MKLTATRIFNLILAVIFIAAGQPGLVTYIAAMHVSLEVLNRQQAYVQSHYSRFNFVFLAYELVLLERFRSFHLPASAEWLMNCAEHASFAIVICSNIYVYLVLFAWRKRADKWKAVLVALVFFTMIGFVNEVYQNRVNGRPLFLLIADSAKDIYMNFIGAGIFFLTAFIKHRHDRRKANLYF